MVNIKENFCFHFRFRLVWTNLKAVSLFNHPAFETLFYNVIYVICDLTTCVGGSIYD